MVVRVVLLCLLAFAGWRAWVAYQGTRARITAIGVAGEPAPTLELTFYPERFAFTSPSPPPPLGTAQLLPGESLSIGDELVPGRAVLRYTGAGIGAGFTFLALGQAAELELRPPSPLWGRVVERRSFWWFGWRASTVPVVGADVIAMGGGEHGISLAATKTGADGAFELDGIAVGQGSLALRVLSPGRAIEHVNVDLVAMTSDGQTIELHAAAPRRGRLLCPPDCAAQDLLVLARGLPGVEARPDADGAFVLEHVPAELEPRLLLIGLPDHLVAKPAVAWIGVAPTIEIVSAAVVRGVVIDASTRQPLGGSLVWSGESAAIRADAEGRFELAQIVPGTIDVTAQHTYQKKNHRPEIRHGSVTVAVAGGAVLDAVVIEVP